MVDFPNPIDPFEHLKVPKIETAVDKEKKKPLVAKPVSRKLFLYLSLLKILSNTFKLFNKPKQKPKSLETTPLHKELLTIQSSLEALRKDDLCQDAEFLNFFAFIWMKFLKDYDNYALKNKAITKLIKELIDDINTYPKGAEFTLGYYISEFAGYKWIPFPYMEILQNLHLEDKKNQESSHLNKWLNILDDLLKKL